MDNHRTDVADASAHLMHALMLLLGTMKRLGFDQRHDAEAVRQAYAATQAALDALVRS